MDPNVIDSKGEISLAVYISPDWSTTTVTATGWTTDGLPFVDVIESRRGDPDRALHRVVDLWGGHDARAVAIDGISAASSLVDPLRRAGVTVTGTNASAMAKKRAADCLTP